MGYLTTQSTDTPSLEILTTETGNNLTNDLPDDIIPPSPGVKMFSLFLALRLRLFKA